MKTIIIKEIDDSPKLVRENGSYYMFVCLEMRYILLRYLFKNDITQLFNMNTRNKFLDEVIERSEIFGMINKYIETNKIEYNGDVIEKEVKDKKKEEEEKREEEKKRKEEGEKGKKEEKGKKREKEKEKEEEEE